MYTYKYRFKEQDIPSWKNLLYKQYIPRFVPDKKFMQNTFWSSESIQNYSIHKNIQNGRREDNENNNENENEIFVSKEDEILFQNFKYSSNIIENLFPLQNSTQSNVTTSESYSRDSPRSPLRGQNSGSPSPLRGQNRGTPTLGCRSIDSRSPESRSAGSRSPLRGQNQSPPHPSLSPSYSPKNKNLTPLDNEINLEYMNINDIPIHIKNDDGDVSVRTKKLNVIMSSSDTKLSSPNKLLPKLQYHTTKNTNYMNL
jgi:hypothetical protein